MSASIPEGRYSLVPGGWWDDIMSGDAMYEDAGRALKYYKPVYIEGGDHEMNDDPDSPWQVDFVNVYVIGDTKDREWILDEDGNKCNPDGSPLAPEKEV